MCSPGTSLFPPRDICWLLSVHSLTGKQSPAARHPLCVALSFSLTLWDGIRAKFCMVKGGSSVAEMKFVANKSLQCVQPYVQPGNGSVPLSYYQISGKVCEIERSLSALFIGLFPPFSFLVEYKEEMKDGLSEVITGIK